MAHGSGGRLMNELIRGFFHAQFNNDYLEKQDDGAVVALPPGRCAFSTDSYVVQPLFFPGGDIGELAVNGTVNDLCMCGAKPLFLSAGFILEEGLPLSDLDRVIRSMARAAQRAGVAIVTGDTKVVDRGKADQLFINTAGIGLIEHDYILGAKQLQPGDKIILSGTIGQHGLAVFFKRKGLEFCSELVSDTAPLHQLTAALLAACGPSLHAMRDPTRGGVAAVLNEFAQASAVEIRINEQHIPLLEAVQNGCQLLGLDPLYLANEGKMTAAVAPDAAQRALHTLQNDPLAADAAIIGEVAAGQAGLVSLQTRLGAWRVVHWPEGELLPRIC